MASLADDLIGEIRLRRAGGRVARGSGFGKARGRRSGAGGSSFSARARDLWRVGQGSNAAVLKKIARGGTLTPGRLKAQLRYLFTKSHALFGNTIGLDPEAEVLSAEQRRAIALDWSDDGLTTKLQGMAGDQGRLVAFVITHR